MALASLAMSVAGAASQATGTYFSALGQKNSLKYQAKMAEINAKMAESDARASLGRGQRAEQASRLETAQLKSAQRVSIASNGLDLGSDTAAAVLTSTDVMGEIDANTIKSNALREAWGHRIQSTSYRSEASMARASASSINPALQAGITLLGGATQVAGQYTDFKKSGALAESKDNWAGYADKAKSFFGSLKGL